MGISAVSAEDESPEIGSGDDYTFSALQEKIDWDIPVQLGLDNYTWEADGNQPIELKGWVLQVCGGYLGNPDEMGTLDARKATYALKIPADCNVTISNVIFINGKNNGNGGAVYIEDGANVIFDNCKFIGNTATNGGAIYGSGYTLIGCEFINNTATGNGGALYVNDEGTISTSKFSGNSAQNGGAVYATDKVEIKYSDFNKNIAQNAGGAVSSNNVSVISSIFNANAARTNGGGAINTKDLLVKHSTFTDNSAVFGGAISALTNLNQVNIPTGVVVDSIFFDNTANNGPGAAIYYTGNLTVSNSSFCGENVQGGSNIFVPSEGILVNDNNAFTSNLHATNDGSNVVVNIENSGESEVTAYVYVPVGATGEVFFALNTEKLKTITLTSGKSKYVEQINNVVYGLNDVVARYMGDSNFIIGEQSVEFNKTHKRDIILDVDVPVINYGQAGVVAITSSIDGPFEVTIGDEKLTVTLENGRKILVVSELKAGGYPVTVRYAGDLTTNEKVVNAMLLVNKLQSTLDLDVVITGVSVTVKVKTNAKSAIIYLDGEYYSEIDTSSGEGSQILVLKGLNYNEGYYTVDVVTNDLDYFVSEATQEFSTDFTNGLYISEVDSPVGNPAAELNAKVLDKEGNPVRQVTVLINIVGNGIDNDYTLRTTADGKTDAISLVDFKAGTYNVTARFSNPSRDGYLYATSQIYIYDLINAENIVVNGTNTFEYTAHITDRDGNPQKNTEVTFKVDGREYKGVTDNNGYVTVNITVTGPGEHNITISATFPPKKHDADPELFEVTQTIDVLPPEMSSLVVTSAVTDNKAVITATLGKNAPGNIIFDVNGEEYIVPITNNKAVLTLNNLENGQYRVHATLDSPKYEVLTNTSLFRINCEKKQAFVGANPIIIVYETPNNPFVVRVVDEFYNPLSGFTVVITVNGTKYNRVTDAKGSTSIPTNKLEIGYYPVTVEFKGGQSYPASTVESYIEVLPVIISGLRLTAAVDCNDVVITAKLSQTVESGVMVFDVDGQKHTVPVTGDTAILTLEGLEKGKYTVTATFESSDYTEISNSTSFTITGMRGVVNLIARNVTMDYGESKYLEIRASDDWGFVIEGLNLVIKLGNQTFYEKTDEDGSVYISLASVNGGEYLSNITFAGNDDYSAASTTARIVVNPITMDYMAVTNTVHYEHAVITVTLPRNVGAGEVIFDVNGETHTVPITGKTASLDLTNLELGSYTVLVTLNSPNCEEINNLTTFDVTATRSIVNIATSNVTMDYGEDKYLTATLTDKVDAPLVNQEVIVKIGDNEITTNTNNRGVISIPLNKLNGGLHQAQIKFEGSDEYAAAVVDVSIQVNPIKMNSMTVQTDVNGTTATITITLSQEVTKGNITLDVNGEVHIVPVTGRTATLSLVNLAEGTYNVKATLNSPNFNAITKNSQFVVSLSKGLTIAVNPLTMYIGATTPLYIYVKDKDGKSVSGLSLRITLDGKSANYKTDSNGRIGLGVSKLTVKDPTKPTVYDVIIAYTGSEYDKTSTNTTVTVLSSIIGDNVQKIYKNDTQFVAKIVDKNGKNLKEGTKVGVNINGGDYERGVKADGTIVFNINLNPGKYVITVTNPSTKQVASFNITVLSNMKPCNFEDEFSLYYRNGTPFRITLLDNHGNPVGPGVLVTMNINGVFYNRTTKDDGAITFNINLNPDRYILTAIYVGGGHDLMQSFIVNVLSTIVAESISMPASNRKAFTATILNGAGKIDVGNRVNININGVWYPRSVTEANHGKITLNINLIPGTYILTVYQDCRWATTSTGDYYVLPQSFTVVVRNE